MAELTDRQAATILTKGQLVGMLEDDELYQYKGRLYVVSAGEAYPLPPNDVRMWQQLS